LQKKRKREGPRWIRDGGGFFSSAGDGGGFFLQGLNLFEINDIKAFWIFFPCCLTLD